MEKKARWASPIPREADKDVLPRTYDVANDYHRMWLFRSDWICQLGVQNAPKASPALLSQEKCVVDESCSASKSPLRPRGLDKRWGGLTLRT